MQTPMLSEPPRCRPFPVLALKGADSPRGLHRGHSPGHMSPPGARSTEGDWLLPASWPDPNSLRQVNPDHDERYRGRSRTAAYGLPNYASLKARALKSPKTNPVRSRRLTQGFGRVTSPRRRLFDRPQGG